jgi:hypothetical protein
VGQVHGNDSCVRDDKGWRRLMPRRVKCFQCKKEHDDDRSCYIGKRPHCSIECAKKTLKELDKNDYLTNRRKANGRSWMGQNS